MIKNLEIGLNTAIGKKLDFPIQSTPLSGKQHLFGGDIRIQLMSLLLSAEYLYADLDGTSPEGFHSTVGWFLNDRNQVLVRLDRMLGGVMVKDRDLLIIGWNYNPNSAIGFQFNYIINRNMTEFRYHRILINTQLAI